MATSLKHCPRAEARAIALSALDAAIANDRRRYTIESRPLIESAEWRSATRTGLVARRFAERFGGIAAQKRSHAIGIRFEQLENDGWPLAPACQLDFLEKYECALDHESRRKRREMSHEI